MAEPAEDGPVGDGPVGDGPVALSGRPAAELTMAALRRGELTQADLRIHPDSLGRQARIAEEHGNPQLAENLRRAAEMTALDDAEVLGIYDALRPGRSSRLSLESLAQSLTDRGLSRCAALVAEAAEVYQRRGMAG